MKQINFKKIEIENFLSVGKDAVLIEFNTGLNIITGINLDKEDSKNGVGKSTIIDALYFCLFGTTIRELKKEEIINNINKKNCTVKLEFCVIENNISTQYILERKISPTKVYLEINGVDATKSSIVKTTEEVCKIIDATPEVFKNSVIMTVNGTIPFMAQRKVEKRKFCEGLFNLGIFQDMLLEERKRYNEVNNEIDIENIKLNEVENTLNIYKIQKHKNDEYKENRLKILLSREVNNDKELKRLNNTIKIINESALNEFTNNIKLLEHKKTSIQHDIRKYIRDIAIKEEKINVKKLDISRLNKFGDMCDKCKRLFTTDDIINRKKKITNINDEILKIKTDIKDNTKLQQDLDDFKNSCLNAIDKQRNNINMLNNDIEYNKDINNRIVQLNIWNKQLKIDIKVLKDELNTYDVLILDTNNRVIGLKKIITKLKDRLNILEVVKHIVSEEGVKSFIVKKLLEIVNGKLAYYLIRLDAPCKFKFNEYFGEQIINDKGQECSYNNFSGGERKRIDLAILFTFMDIRRLQGNTSLNVTFYDEILDTSLDNKGIECFLEIIRERIKKYNEAAYIISHKSIAIESDINDIIFLEKRNGFTTVGDITNYGFTKEIL